MMNTTNEPKRELIPLKLIEPWARNPRGGDLRDMEAFTEQLRMEGIREDVHVFRDAQGVLRLMQGHRRREAAQRLGVEALWAKVWPFDENEAFLHLITMQNGSDPFDARELALASRTAMQMGITREAWIGVMHRSEETVQLYLDLGTLPHRVQEAVYRGKLALGTAGLMRQLSKEQMELAMDGVLNNPITQEPMTEGQAKVYIENQFLKPERWRKEWVVLAPKIKRKLIGQGWEADRIDVVAWEDREQFVMSEAVPVGSYMMWDEYIEDALMLNPGEPMTWGKLAHDLGVPWHLAPAAARVEKHLCLVKLSAVKDADSTSAERVLRGKGETRKVLAKPSDAMPERVAATVTAEVAEVEDLELSAEVPVAFDEVRWRKIHGALMLRPESAMQNALWESLMEIVWRDIADRLPADAYASIMGELNRDEVKRKGLRWCLLACVALALCEPPDEDALHVVEESLGVQAK